MLCPIRCIAVAAFLFDSQLFMHMLNSNLLGVQNEQRPSCVARLCVKMCGPLGCLSVWWLGTMVARLFGCLLGLLLRFLLVRSLSCLLASLLGEFPCEGSIGKAACHAARIGAFI